MRSRWVVGATAALALLASLLLAARPLIADSSGEEIKVIGPWIYGSTGARFTIIEYADLECPYCKDYFPELKAWVDAHSEVNLQWHHLPLPMHEPIASQEARWAECAGMVGGNSAFWLAVECIYQQTRSNGLGLSGKLAPQGLEAQQKAIEGCALQSADAKKSVSQQAVQAATDGINATPTLVVVDRTSGRSLKLQGAPDGNVLLSALDWLMGQPKMTHEASRATEP